MLLSWLLCLVLNQEYLCRHRRFIPLLLSFLLLHLLLLSVGPSQQAQHGMMMSQGSMQMPGQQRMMVRNIGQPQPGGNLRQASQNFGICDVELVAQVVKRCPTDPRVPS